MFRHHITLLVIALLLTISLLVGAVALPFGNIAKAEHSMGFGIRVNLMIDNDITPLFNAAQIMRVDWLVQEIQWKQIEPQAGQYKWEKLDAMMTAVRPYGFRVMLSIAGTPNWARVTGGDPAYDAPPADPATFARFIAALTKRYNGAIGAIEIYPESNIASHWSTPSGVSPERYVELLKAAHTAVHSADPMVIVVGGSLAPTASNDGKNTMDDLQYYKQIYKAGGMKYMDVLGVRVDGHNNPPSDFVNVKSTSDTTYKNNSAFYFRHYEDVRTIMNENGDKDKKLWITSAGWASSNNKVEGKEFAADVSEQEQADYIIGALNQLESQNYVSAFMLNNFNYSTTAGNEPSALYSLIRADWSARPAFLKLAQARQDFNAVNSQPTNTSANQPHLLPNWRPRQRPVFGVAP